MTRIPQDVRPTELIKFLESLGFERARQSGSHIIMKHYGPPERTIAIPAHRTLKAGTLRSILQSVSLQTGLSLEDLARKL
ncbi:type II toxin-antitoxin system HicA family toxin [bacterium]|nr:type II toxin-antitoxin system HicA family toxin [bacterium]